MAGLPRKTQQIWGGNLTPNGNIGQPGSLASGLEVYSNDPAVLQAGAWLNGWVSAIVGTDSPVLEEFNGILFTLTQQLAYIFARGIPEYDAATTYNTGDLAKAIGASTIYASKIDGNLNQPFSNTNNWKVFGSDLFDALGAADTAQANANAYTNSVSASDRAYTDAQSAAAQAAAEAASDPAGTSAAAIAAIQPALAKAWVSFNSAGGIFAAFNVSSINVNGAGNYSVNVINPLPSSSPVVVYLTGGIPRINAASNTSVNISSVNNNGTPTFYGYNCVVIFA